MIYCILIFGLFQMFGFSAQARGWEDIGSGSAVILCEDASLNRVYDTYETEVRYKKKVLPPSLIGTEELEQVLNMAQSFIEPLKPLDQNLYQKLSTSLNEFSQRVRFLHNIQILDIPDVGMIVIPEKCEKRQLVLQRAPKFPNEPMYTISLYEWNQISTVQKSIAVLHEVLFGFARGINSRLKTSEPIRYFNSLLVSDSFTGMSPQEYRQVYMKVFLWLY